MVKIAFWDNQLCERGSTVALFDYAFFNKTILGNESIVLYDVTSWNNNADVIKHFEKEFQVFGVADFALVDEILVANKCDLLYIIKCGENDGKVSRSVKTVVHCIFHCNEPHGDVYAAISPCVSGNNGRFPVVPHIVRPPITTTTTTGVRGDLREKLKIPKNAVVFGRHGGFLHFDIPYVQRVVFNVASKFPNIYFLFLNTAQFWLTDLPNIIHLPIIVDLEEKARFINSCDAMLWARSAGETFGLAIAEFSVCNKPVIATKVGDLAHAHFLGDKALWYTDESSLFHILTTFSPVNEEIAQKDWNAFRFCQPKAVMTLFKQVFIDEENDGKEKKDGALASIFGERIYCINLDRSPDRWRAQRKQFLQVLHSPLQRVAAIDGRATPRLIESALRDNIIAPDADFLPMEEKRRLGVTALIQTTVSLWRAISERGGDGGGAEEEEKGDGGEKARKEKDDLWHLICEDDVLFDSCAADRDYMRFVWSQMPQDAEMILFGFTLHFKHHIREESNVTEYVRDVNSAICQIVKPVCGTHCYAIKSSTAKRLLAMCLPFRRAVDMSFPIDKIKVYATRNPPGWPGSICRSDELRVHYGIAGIMPFNSTINDQNYSESGTKNKQKTANFDSLLQLQSGLLKGKSENISPLRACDVAYRAASDAHQGEAGHRIALAFALAARAFGGNQIDEEKQFLIDDEIAVCGYWSGAYAEAHSAVVRQLANSRCVDRARIESNLQFIQEKLDSDDHGKKEE